MFSSRVTLTLGVLLTVGLLSTTQAYDNGAPHSRLPTMGWSSWVALGPGAEHPVFDYCDEFSVKQAADAFIEVGLYDAGYRHFHLDDCWAGGRNSSGYIYPEEDHFPNGMKSVVDYVHGKNLTFGLYTCAGDFVCVGGRPGSKDHWEQDAAMYAEWGVDWVKMDWCHTEGMDVKTSYGAMSKALNSSGRSIHFNMCEWGLEEPWTWGNEVAQSWRMSHDHTGTWSSTKSQIEQVSHIPAANTGRPYGWNDMDMLETGCREQCAHANGHQATLTDLEYVTEFSMWAISASPLQFTAPIMNCSAPLNSGSPVCKGWISDLQRKILLNQEVIAVNQDITPQGRPVVDGDLSIWARHLSDGSVAVALYNEDDDAVDVAFDFTTVGWKSSTTASARDLWQHSDLGDFTGRYPQTGTVSVAPHETQMIRFTSSSL